MKLFDKIKNAFFEEEYVEVVENKKEKEKPVSKEPVAKKIDLPEPKLIYDDEEVNDELDQVEEESSDVLVSDRDLLRDDSDFKFPILDDEDFAPVSKVVEEEPVYEPSLYNEEPVIDGYYNTEYSFADEGPYSKKEDKKAFKPSPVISPVYGMLDRNYHKEEIVPKVEIRSSYEKSKVNLDDVRKKAYGVDKAIEDEYEEPVEFTVEIEETVVDMTNGEGTPQVEKVTLADAEEYFQDLGLEYNIDYKDNTKDKAKGRRSEKARDEDVKTDEETDESLESNLFDLIDSMYDKDKE